MTAILDKINSEGKEARVELYCFDGGIQVAVFLNGECQGTGFPRPVRHALYRTSVCGLGLTGPESVVVVDALLVALQAAQPELPRRRSEPDSLYADPSSESRRSPRAAIIAALANLRQSLIGSNA